MPGGSLFNSSADAEYDAEYDTLPEPEPEVSPNSIDDLVDEASGEEEELDDEMSEAERRISLAGYYKILTKGGIFNDGSEEARIVDQQVKAFAREQVIILLNLPGQQKKQEFPFSDLQVEALSSMADRLIERQGLQAAAIPVAAPTVRPQQAPVAPVATKPVKPAGPQVRALTAPAGSKRPAVAPTKKKAAVVKATPVAVEKTKRGTHTVDNTEIGVIFEENGKKYKFVNHPDGGEPIKLNVTSSRRQVAHPGAIPMPTELAMGPLSEQQANLNINSNSAMKSNILMTAAALSSMEKD